MQPLLPAHQDYALLNVIADEILKRAGGETGLSAFVPQMLRDKIDSVIDTPETNRRSYEELEKTEKTYIGTLVEIAFRSRLKLSRGKKDLVIAGHTVDVKTTVTGNWMIPKDCIGIPCVLVSASEVRARCSLGLIVARPEYMTQRQNQDKKVSIAAAARVNIWWLLKDEPYPPNFWRRLDQATIDRIFAPTSGNARMVKLFKELPGRPISRKVVEAVAAQKDFMRRVRADGPRGTRGRLAAAGFVLLSGTYDTLLITQLGLQRIGPSDFISHQLRDEGDRMLARGAGYPI
jgi:Restriction endonuclease NaeI